MFAFLAKHMAKKKQFVNLALFHLWCHGASPFHSIAVCQHMIIIIKTKHCLAINEALGKIKKNIQEDKVI